MGRLPQGKKMEFKGYLDPEELLPGELRPPAPFIEAASRDLPGVLLDMGTSPREDNVERLVRSLVKLGHNRTVCQWALYDHIKAGRIEVEIHSYDTYLLFNDEGGAIRVSTPNEDSVAFEHRCQVLRPTSELNTWWELAVSDGKTSHDLDPLVATQLQKAILKAINEKGLETCEQTSKDQTAPLFKIEQWNELGIGIDETRSYLAIVPRPVLGGRFPKRKAKTLPLNGNHWQILLDLLSKSEYGNAADRTDLASQLYRESISSCQEAEEFRFEHKSQAKDVMIRLSKRIAELGQDLRKYVEGPKGHGQSALSVNGDYVMSGFVVQYLVQDQNGKLCFGKAPAK